MVLYGIEHTLKEVIKLIDDDPKIKELSPESIHIISCLVRYASHYEEVENSIKDCLRTLGIQQSIF